MPQFVETTTIEFATADGVSLAGDLAQPTSPVGAAIICHPHPQHGGNRFNNVVEALFAALPAAGITALRFDFRADFDHGKGELLDAAAAIQAVAATSADVPLFATGYSFGAAIALGLDDPRLSAKVLIAPPLAMIDPSPAMAVSTLVLTPAHDQFTSPEQSEPIVAGWAETTHEVIESADHFLVGRSTVAAQRTTDFLLACS